MLPNTFIEKFFQTKRKRKRKRSSQNETSSQNEKMQNETNQNPSQKANQKGKQKQNQNQKRKNIIGYYEITSASSSGGISAKLYTVDKKPEGILTRTNIQELQKTRDLKNW
jgi:sortase (surface protein transpeptidase)